MYHLYDRAKFCHFSDNDDLIMIYFFLNVLTNPQNGYSKCLKIFSLRCM